MESNFELISKDEYALAELKDLSQLAIDYAKQARSKNTNKAYACDWQDFEFWCKLKHLSCLPADPRSVAIYLADRAANSWIDKNGTKQNSLKTSSLLRRLTAISQVHLLANLSFDRRHSSIQETWKGIKNTHGTAQLRKEPILIEDLRAMIQSISIEKNGKPFLLGIRDRAILLLGFAGAFRRSEIVALDIEDLKFTREGCLATIRKSKTDQEGFGREVAIPYGSNPLTCPVRALQDWLKESNLESGALFRSINRHRQIQSTRLTDHSIAIIIKRNAHLSDRSFNFSGHSLRAGFATTAAIAEVPEHIIMRQTGHKKSDTIKKYIRIGNRWRENAATKVGL